MKTEFRNLLISTVVQGFAAGFMLVGLPLFLKEQNVSLESLGVAFSLATLIYGILTYYVASHSDISGRRWIGTIALILMACATLSVISIQSFGMTLALIVFVCAKVVHDLAGGIYAIIVKARVVDLSSKNRHSVDFAHYIGYSGTGVGAGMLVGGITTQLFSFTATLYGVVFFYIVALIMFRTSGDARTHTKEAGVFHFRYLKKMPPVFKYVLLFNTAIYTSAYTVDFFAMPLYLEGELGVSPGMAIFIIGAAWFLYGIGCGLVGHFNHTLKPRNVIICGIIAGCTSFVFLLPRSGLGFALVLIFDYLLFVYLDIYRTAAIGSLAVERKGMILSFFDLVKFIAVTIAYLCVGFLVAQWGYHFLYIVRAGIIFLCVWCTYKISQSDLEM